MALEKFNDPARQLPVAKSQGAIQGVFLLRSRVGRNIYVIRGQQLEITWGLFGMKYEQRVQIQSISPHYEVRGTRFLRTVALLLVPVALCIIVMRLLTHVHGMPDGLLWLPAEVGAAFLIAAFKFLPRFEWFEFKNHFGRVIFTILREPAQRSECDAFIHALLDRIEAADQGAELPEYLPTKADEPEKSADVARWKLAIGLSLFAIVTPLMARALGDRSDVLVIVPIVVGTGGALACAFYSYASKERYRLWALVAAVAALFPPFFY